MSEAAMVLQRRQSYTVDDLFVLPDDGRRYEVFGGALHVSPSPTAMHQVVVSNLSHHLRPVIRPAGAVSVSGVAVRVSDVDGPIPDLTVVSKEARHLPRAVPLADVYTVIEVVSPSSTLMDRTLKPELYADAGIPCYWRVELKPTRKYAGPLPLVVVTLGGSVIEAGAGLVAELPLAVGREEGDIVSIRLDPATLVDL